MCSVSQGTLNTIDLESALHEHFGHRQFRPGQDAIVHSIVDGKDVLVVMPTGGGKSLCYQLPALLKEGLTLVVSPLIALMKDQVDALQARGVAATLINSSLGPAEQRERIEALARGEYRLVYIAPERFRHERFVEALGRCRIAFVAIDEAHCVSMWGHDFRPDYLRVGESLKRIGSPQVGAFTATATPEVRADIEKHLALREPDAFVTGFARPNLTFHVTACSSDAEKYNRLDALIEKHKTGIIYCATRKKVEEVYARVEEWDVAAVAYHGGMSDEIREAAQNRFIRGEADVAVATNAFGMGIDRADIRFVAHFQIPGSVEAYYQEAGRSGRDGKPAECDLLYSFPDTFVQEFFIENSNPGIEELVQLYTLLRHFAEDNHEVQLSIQEMADKLGSGMNTMLVSSSLSLLGRHRIIERFDIPGQRKRGTRLRNPGLAPHEIPVDAEGLAEKKRRDLAKLQSVIDYAQALECRQARMLHYFGDEDAEPCGHCDNCRAGSADSVRAATDDEKMIVRKALSGVARMSRRMTNGSYEPRFGRTKIMQMLTGSRDKAILDIGLDRLSTYGLLADEGMEYVRDLFREMQRAGYLQVTGGERPLITLTEMGAEAMRDHLTIELRWPERLQERRYRAQRTRSRDSGIAVPRDFSLNGGGDPDPGLLARLKKKRSQLAAIRKVKPFQIFPNRVLEGLAAEQPLSREEALGISGIGEVNARKSLQPFLQEIAEWRAERAGS